MAYPEDDEDELGQYLDDIAASRPLSAEEESALAKRIRAGDQEARDKLVEANLFFVISVAKDYRGRGVPLRDLVSVGNMGMITAAERFDETRGFKFITYAVWWIRQRILQIIAEQARAVRLPLNKVGLLYKISKAKAQLEQVGIRNPTAETLAQYLDEAEEEVSQVIESAQKPVYLDQPKNRDPGAQTLANVVPNKGEATDAAMEKRALLEEVENFMFILDEREDRIIRLYFGLGDQTPLTLEVIGGLMNLTRERVRQLKERALGKMRERHKRDMVKAKSSR